MENVPQDEQFTMSFYRIKNDKNIGNCNPNEADYDLLEMIIIRLGTHIYSSDEKNLFEFLSMILYPGGMNDKEKVEKYIDFSQHKELKEEVDGMAGLSQFVWNVGYREGTENAIKETLQFDREMNSTFENAKARIMKVFKFDSASADAYLDKYWEEK